MRRALKSSLSRFVKSRLLAEAVIAGILMGAITFLFLGVFELAINMFRRPRYMDNSYLTMCLTRLPLFFTVFQAVLSSQFTGRDIGMRTINNRISTGFSRSSIFLADLLVMIISSLLSEALCAATIFALVKTVPVKSGARLDPKITGLLIMLGLISIAFASLFTLFQYFLSNRLLTLIICVLMLPALIFFTGNIDSALEEPYKYEFTDDVTGITETRYNELYLTGKKREIYIYLSEASPYNMYGVISSREISRGDTVALITFALSSGLGLLAISKKEFP